MFLDLVILLDRIRTDFSFKFLFLAAQSSKAVFDKRSLLWEMSTSFLDKVENILEVLTIVTTADLVAIIVILYSIYHSLHSLQHRLEILRSRFSCSKENEIAMEFPSQMKPLPSEMTNKYKCNQESFINNLKSLPWPYFDGTSWHWKLVLVHWQSIWNK